MAADESAALESCEVSPTAHTLEVSVSLTLSSSSLPGRISSVGFVISIDEDSCGIFRSGG